jgi:zona occludens toxin (predicted ATPase)
MIIFYEGVPGSGKSYDAVVKIVANLKKRRIVYTNIDGIDDCKCKEMIKCLTGLDDFDIDKFLIVLTREQTFHFWDFVTQGSFVVIDEMQKFFNSRDWQKEENRVCADWCSTHRHEGYDALFLTQRIEKVDTQIRTLTEWTYRYKKVNFLGKLVSKAYVCFAYSGDDTKSPLSKIVRQYDKKYFHCYKSYIAKDVKELGIQSHANILKHPIFFLIPIAIIATIYFISRSGFTHGGIINTIKGSAFSSAEAKVPENRSINKNSIQPATLPKTNINEFNNKYAFAGAFNDKIVVEDRATGEQQSLSRVIGTYKLLEINRNVSCVVFSGKGETITFSNSSRYKSTDKAARVPSADLAVGSGAVINSISGL